MSSELSINDQLEIIDLSLKTAANRLQIVKISNDVSSLKKEVAGLSSALTKIISVLEVIRQPLQDSLITKRGG